MKFKIFKSLFAFALLISPNFSFIKLANEKQIVFHNKKAENLKHINIKPNEKEGFYLSSRINLHAEFFNETNTQINWDDFSVSSCSLIYQIDDQPSVEINQFSLDNKIKFNKDDLLKSYWINVSTKRNIAIILKINGVLSNKFSFSAIKGIKDFYLYTNYVNHGVDQDHRLYRTNYLENVYFLLRAEKNDYIYPNNDHSIAKYQLDFNFLKVYFHNGSTYQLVERNIYGNYENEYFKLAPNWWNDPLIGPSASLGIKKGFDNKLDFKFTYYFNDEEIINKNILFELKEGFKKIKTVHTNYNWDNYIRNENVTVVNEIEYAADSHVSIDKNQFNILLLFNGLESKKEIEIIEKSIKKIDETTYWFIVTFKTIDYDTDYFIDYAISYGISTESKAKKFHFYEKKPINYQLLKIENNLFHLTFFDDTRNISHEIVEIYIINKDNTATRIPEEGINGITYQKITLNIKEETIQKISFSFDAVARKKQWKIALRYKNNTIFINFYKNVNATMIAIIIIFLIAFGFLSIVVIMVKQYIKSRKKI